MDNEPGSSGTKLRRYVLTFAIVTVLLVFFSVPIAIFIYVGIDYSL